MNSVRDAKFVTVAASRAEQSISALVNEYVSDEDFVVVDDEVDQEEIKDSNGEVDVIVISDDEMVVRKAVINLN